MAIFSARDKRFVDFFTHTSVVYPTIQGIHGIEICKTAFPFCLLAMGTETDRFYGSSLDKS